MRARLPVLYRAQILTYLVAAAPDLPGAVAAFSAGVVPRQISGASRPATVRHYLRPARPGRASGGPAL